MIVPLVVPSSTTLAPMIGIPLESVIVPLTRFVCCWISVPAFIRLLEEIAAFAARSFGKATPSTQEKAKT
ncbi:hypothetical protein NXX40_25400 (plasmid) [Parabacteroides distasonis]|nr:hypothetical protein [Parabacteroides distasonis]